MCVNQKKHPTMWEPNQTSMFIDDRFSTSKQTFKSWLYTSMEVICFFKYGSQSQRTNPRRLKMLPMMVYVSLLRRLHSQFLYWLPFTRKISLLKWTNIMKESWDCIIPRNPLSLFGSIMFSERRAREAYNQKRKKETKSLLSPSLTLATNPNLFPASIHNILS
jgi:hypothetical protein